MSIKRNPFNLVSRPRARVWSSIGTCLLTLGSILGASSTCAESATWALDPTTGYWVDGSDWTPNTVPNGPDDVATFGVSSILFPFISEAIEVNSIVFNSDASQFRVDIAGKDSLTISGAGIINDSSVTQTFDLLVVTGFPEGGAAMRFLHTASAGVSTSFVVARGQSGGDASVLSFFDASSAGGGIFLNEGGKDKNSAGGLIFFGDTSSAGNGTFSNEGAVSRGGAGAVQFAQNATADHGTFLNEALPAASGAVQFMDSSTGAQGSFTNFGATKTGGSSGATQFFDSSTAGDAMLIASSNAGSGGLIQFNDASDGGMARVEVFGNGNLDISAHIAGAVTIGSVEGDGQVFLGGNDLSVGSNDLSTAFSGVAQDGGLSGGAGGSVTKIGAGRLTLSGANTYTGGTTVEAGTLLVQTRRASATGTGPMQVNGGTLGGRGKMLGPVTIGDGTGSGAFLAPGVNGPAGLTTQGSLTFNADGTYNCELDTNRAKADKIVARGVTINSGAQFVFLGKGSTALPAGTAFTVIDNRTSTPISGTFANLADDSTFTANGNNFQVSYEGGNGNDLTLTVVP